MTYLVLARKWRPRSFDTLIGQDHVVRALTHALSTQRLHHAWLFTGTRGVGKTTLARLLAKSLNCEQGITPAPCGVCRACTEIDAGRFVDYLELDAASNRGVDEMTQLLEQAVYAPSSGRYKVYMIDEVHMLTGHAFNAMLKTLEEPPPHVKFILATTDPQKIPVTVLSRCLQFNLKQMAADAIVSHLQMVLGEEHIGFETPALRLIAQAASGSMRDALSLTDQAIAYSAGQLSTEAIQGMLGTIDQRYLLRLLQALADGSAGEVLVVADELATRGLSYTGALADLAVLLSRVAIEQRIPGAVPADDPMAEDIASLGRHLAPDLVQLFYSVAVHSRNELSLAPDEYAGFVMACLRMLALAPVPAEPAAAAPPVPAPQARRGSEAASVPLAGGQPGSQLAVPASPALRASPLAGATHESAPAEPTRTPATASSPPSRAPAPSEIPVQTEVSVQAVVPVSPETPAQSGVAARPRSSVQAAAPDHFDALVQPQVPAKPGTSAGSTDHAPASVESTAQQIRPTDPTDPTDRPADRSAPLAEPAAPAAPAPRAETASPSRAETPADPQALGDVPAWEDIPVDENAGQFEPYDGQPDVDNEAFESMAAVPDDVPLPSFAPARKKLKSPRLRDMTPTAWPLLAAQLPLTGLAAELARQSEWLGAQGDEIRLRVAVRTLAESQGQARLCTLLSEHFGTVVRLSVEYGATGDETAHAVAQAEKARRQSEAEQAAQADPFVQTLISDFGAALVPGSVRAAMADKAV